MITAFLEVIWYRQSKVSWWAYAVNAIQYIFIEKIYCELAYVSPFGLLADSIQTKVECLGHNVVYYVLFPALIDVTCYLIG